AAILASRPLRAPSNSPNSAGYRLPARSCCGRSLTSRIRVDAVAIAGARWLEIECGRGRVGRSIILGGHSFVEFGARPQPSADRKKFSGDPVASNSGRALANWQSPETFRRPGWWENHSAEPILPRRPTARPRSTARAIDGSQLSAESRAFTRLVVAAE